MTVLTWIINDVDLSLAQTLDVFRLLTLTYPLYHDPASRDAAEDLGMQLVLRDEERPQEERQGVAEHIVGWLGVEVGRITKRGYVQVHLILSFLCMI